MRKNIWYSQISILIWRRCGFKPTSPSQLKSITKWRQNCAVCRCTLYALMQGSAPSAMRRDILGYWIQIEESRSAGLERWHWCKYKKASFRAEVKIMGGRFFPFSKGCVGEQDYLSIRFLTLAPDLFLFRRDKRRNQNSSVFCKVLPAATFISF